MNSSNYLSQAQLTFSLLLIFASRQACGSAVSRGRPTAEGTGGPGKLGLSGGPSAINTPKS